MENQLIRGQVFDVLFNYAEKWGSICTESDCATVRDEICLRIDQSQFTADEAEDYINQEVEKRIVETVAMYGWICPRCGAVHSPFDLRCDCPPPVRTWISSSTGEWSVLDGKTEGGEG